MVIEKVLVDTTDKFEQFLNEIDKDVICFDTETTALKIQDLKLVGMSFFSNNKTWYLPFGHTTQEQQLNWDDCKIKLNKLFYGAKGIIGHNLVYDMQVLKKYDIFPENVKWFDTMVAQHLVDENERKGLKFLAKKYFDYDMETFQEVSSVKKFANVTLKNATSYACDDAIYTYKLYELLKPKLVGVENLFYSIEMPFLRCIIDMEWNGVLIDQIKLKELDVAVRERIQHYEKEIVSHLPKKYTQTSLLGDSISVINLGSSQQVSKLLFEDLGLPVKERSEKTGKPSTGTPSLKQIKNEHPIIPALIKHKEYKKLKNAFINALPNHISNDGRVHANFINTGTVTGRLSSANVNMQQIPKNDEINLRSCFIASPKTKFITLDYKQEELRLAAFVANDEDMIKAYEEGLDLHLLTANKIFSLGLTEEELIDGTTAYNKAKIKYSKERDKAKATVFGILFGAGKENLSGRLQITPKEAQEIIDGYFKVFPKVKKYIDETHNEVRKQGFVKNYYGRRRHFKKVNWGYSNNVYRQSFNFKIQGFAADLLRVAMGNIRKFLREHNFEARFIFTVHDEITLEVPEDKVDFYLINIKKIMESSLVCNPPLIATGGVGNNYAEAK